MTHCKLFQDRNEAGRLLSRKLIEYKTANTVVVGIPYSGVCVASAIADSLSVPLEVIPCRRIKHPGNKLDDIGSVSLNEVFLHDCSYTIPQDYIYHKTLQLRNEIRSELNYYNGDNTPESLQNKIVIVVDDILRSSETMIACLREIKRQDPLKVVIAVPLITTEAVVKLETLVDDIIFLQKQSSINFSEDYFINYPNVSEATVKELWDHSKHLNPVG